MTMASGARANWPMHHGGEDRGTKGRCAYRSTERPSSHFTKDNPGQAICWPPGPDCSVEATFPLPLYSHDAFNSVPMSYPGPSPCLAKLILSAHAMRHWLKSIHQPALTSACACEDIHVRHDLQLAGCNTAYISIFSQKAEAFKQRSSYRAIFDEKPGMRLTIGYHPKPTKPAPT